MKYTVQFTGTKVEKETQAREATIEYLGKAKYELLISEAAKMKTWRQTMGRTQWYCILCGIEGYYPVRAVLRDALNRRTK